MITFYKLLPFIPQIPIDLEQDIMFCIRDNNRFYFREGINKYFISEKLNSWINANIVPVLGKNTYIDNASIQKITPTYCNNPPHTDGSGECVLFYFIKLGGDNIFTNWWVENKKPLVRELGIKISDWNSFTKVAEVVLPSKQWVSITSNIFHNVSNVITDRISLSIRLKNPTIIIDNNF